MKKTRAQKRQDAACDLRDYAAHRECQIRLPGCANEPTCLCHWRQIGISGAGLKAPDLLGAWGCHNCHQLVDTQGRDDPGVQLAFARAIFRTQNALIESGIVSW